MDQEIKGRWVEALRSGEYEQGKNALRIGDGFCCLGVLCDIAVKDGVIEAPRIEGAERYHIYGGSEYTLPARVQEWSAIGSDNPLIVEDRDGFPINVAGLNDGGLTFAQLADLIDREL